MSKQVLAVILVGLVYSCISNIGLVADADEVTEADVAPHELTTDCTWERKDDYRKPNTAKIFYHRWIRISEPLCKQKCAESVVCNYANYMAKDGSCQLVPRKAFHRSFVSRDRSIKGGRYVMWAKNCPVEDFLNRSDDPEEFVMCRMERVNQALDQAYVYQYAQYMQNRESRDEAEWWCRTDPLCKAISYRTKYSNHHWLFYYKVVVVGTTQGDNNVSSIKNCQPSASDCLFTSYKKKMLTGEPYMTLEYPNYLTLFECEEKCERDSSCYAAVGMEGSWRRNGRTCLLYNSTSAGQLTPLKRFARYYSRTWLKNHCSDN